MNICVYAASSNALSPAFYVAAEELGCALGKNGHTLVFGGGAGGLMGACARGVEKAGGRCVGIAPRSFDEPGVLLREGCELVFTDTLSQRKAEMSRLSDAFIALPGGIGTYEEFFETLTLRQLGQHHKPMALLNVCGYYDSLLALLRHTAEENFMSPGVLDLFKVCCTPEEAITAISSSHASLASVPFLSQYSP